LHRRETRTAISAQRYFGEAVLPLLKEAALRA
jgi:hypothetical protein